MEWLKRIWNVVKDLSRIIIWIVFIIVMITLLHFLKLQTIVNTNNLNLIQKETDALATLKHDFKEELINACVERIKVEAHYIDAELGQALHSTTTKNTP